MMSSYGDVPHSLGKTEATVDIKPQIPQPVPPPVPNANDELTHPTDTQVYAEASTEFSASRPEASQSTEVTDSAYAAGPVLAGDKPIAKRPVPTKLFVGNIAREALDEDLRFMFEAYGEVAECSILSDYGFVHFYSPHEAEVAQRELNGKLFMGRKLKVEKSTSFVRKRPNDSTDENRCYVCGRNGHWAKDCSQVPPEERERQHRRANMKMAFRRGDIDYDPDSDYDFAMKRRRRNDYPADRDGYRDAGPSAAAIYDNYTDFANDDILPRRRPPPPPPGYGRRPLYDPYDVYDMYDDYYDYYRPRRPLPPPRDYYDLYYPDLPPRPREPLPPSLRDPYERPPPEYYESRPRRY